MTHGAPSPYTNNPKPKLPEYLYDAIKTFQFGSTKLTLPALRVNADTVIYVLNIMGGIPSFITVFATDLLYGLDTSLSMKNDVFPIDGFISAEGKSIPLVYEIASQSELPYVVLRKACKPYMGEAVLSSKINTITTGAGELFLDGKDYSWVYKKRLVFVDDVVSSGATLNATKEIVEQASGSLVGCLVMAIEGEYVPSIPTYSLAKLPIIKFEQKDGD
jgi:adenine/guanine phosphoribosyltransferase-like PRPP-binding protein